ncbi:intraflagellar transport protein 46 homolog isoform X2 [Apus apus]|uniref:intraflagellar transport protein 46 homolog isoform X2 n=1 Tax=Apus apus TaxID=8895 RepID=UPI0021F8397D|nr:intraflagellar transport protein 46 homolog isoform X2 [Apus apus]
MAAPATSPAGSSVAARGAGGGHRRSARGRRGGRAALAGLRASKEGASPRRRGRPGRAGALEPRLVQNEPYDGSLELPEAEEAGGAAGRPAGARSPGRPRGARRPGLPGSGSGAVDRSSDEEGSGDKGEKVAPSAPPTALSEEDDDDDDDDSEEEDSSETDSEDDSEEHGATAEGDFSLADFDYLPVSSEIKELFEYIKRYTPKTIAIEPKLQPFIPEFIPAVGDIDAFLKVPPPDGKPDHLGLLVLDEPSTKQSDPTVLSLWLTENCKQHNISQIKVKSLENAEKNPKAIESWIESISELHRCKPPATVLYTRPMPDIESLMQEWSPEFEELLGKVGLPTAEMSCDLPEYIDMICGKWGLCWGHRCATGLALSLKARDLWAQPGQVRSFSAAFSREQTLVPQSCSEQGAVAQVVVGSGVLSLSLQPSLQPQCSHTPLLFLVAILDIPVYKSQIQPLHVLFSLYSEFKNSQHFKPLADGNKGRTSPPNPSSQAAEEEVLTFT